MSVVLDGRLPVSQEEAEQLWQRVWQVRPGAGDATVTVRVVSRVESQRLKREYKEVDQPTNVLTFSYDPLPGQGEEEAAHDIALCLEVAQEEATERGVILRDYIAWLLVHAFLHATGMDHELSAAEARAMQVLEKKILTEAGFRVKS